LAPSRGAIYWKLELDIRRNSESPNVEPQNFLNPKIPDFSDNYKKKGRGHRAWSMGQRVNFELRIANCGFQKKKKTDDRRH
jgi:hypothetical protein